MLNVLDQLICSAPSLHRLPTMPLALPRSSSHPRAASRELILLVSVVRCEPVLSRSTCPPLPPFAMHRRKNTTSSQQRTHRPVLSNLTSTKHNDPPYPFRHGRAVRHRYHRTPSAEERQGLLDLGCVGAGEAPCGLIEQQDAGILESSTRDAEALAEGLVQGGGMRADNRVVALREGKDGLMNPNKGRSIDNLLAGGVAPEGNICLDCAGEEHCLLRHKPNQLPQPLRIKSCHIRVVEQYKSLPRVKEPLNHRERCALATSCGTADANVLPGIHGQTDTIKCFVIRGGGVTEGYVAKLHTALDGR
mmetsp:Transcript_25475/g.61378  ORF Transcript_25475/g.61378 Transcript_25475/m.61378 type:complete len:305 (+) Transcript_25475:389-1303(+)